MTAWEIRRHLRERLSPLGEEADRLAALLWQYGSGKEALSPEETVRLEQMADRCLAGEPLQYVLGEWEFFSLPFQVGPGVLIPRPDTECLVEQALHYIKGHPSARVADLCSGSGAIGVAVAHQAPTCRVTAVEWDETAFGYLERNIRLNGVDSVHPVRADVLAGPLDLGPFDLILSNPPYIPTEDIAGLDERVKKEPTLALDGGVDGLTFYRALLSLWVPALSEGGAMMVEIGFDQKESVSALFRQRFARVECIRDYGGNDRVIIGTEIR